MLTKIAQITLNSGKLDGASEVYIAQPDAPKESLAGRIFVFGSIVGKKADGRKIFDFLIDSLSHYYYGDEKILWRGRSEGLDIENVFESALAKTNKSLAEFLLEEKIRLQPGSMNISLGVVFEDQLYFANHGRNRAFLVHRLKDEYSVINVEAQAEEVHSSVPDSGPQPPKIFSSIVSGAIPTNAYFIFSNEALPEYLSNRELISIITKLPPIVAAEQIKNTLGKINAFVPFLGMIIKNVAGSMADSKEDSQQSQSANSSISSLNYTEQKTERILAPVGAFNLNHAFSWGSSLARRLRAFRPEHKNKPRQAAEAPAVSKPSNLPRQESFLISEKIFLKRSSGRLLRFLKQAPGFLASIFSPRRISADWRAFRIWLSGMDGRQKSMFIGIIAVALILVTSLAIGTWQTKQRRANSQIAAAKSQIAEKLTLIDSLLETNAPMALNNAQVVFSDVQALAASLPNKTKSQQAAYAEIEKSIAERADHLQKLVKIPVPELFKDLGAYDAQDMSLANGEIFAGGSQVYRLNLSSGNEQKLAIDGTTSFLSRSTFDGKDGIYFLAGDSLVKIGLKSGQSSVTKISAISAESLALSGFKVYSEYLYAVDAAANKIYRVSRSGDAYAAKADWLKSATDLSSATDIGVDGDLYVLRANGAISKFRKGEKQSFESAPVFPGLSAAKRLIVGTARLYVLDSQAKRLVVFDKKDGSLIVQYEIGLAELKDVAVDEAGKTAYILGDKGIYKFALNQ